MNKLHWFSAAVTVALMASTFLWGLGVGGLMAARPVELAHAPSVFVDVDVNDKTQKELKQCRALSEEKNRILEEDRILGEQVCHERIDMLLQESYPKDSRLIVRSGKRLRGEVGWFVGRDAPKGTCSAGSLYSQTDAGLLYVCQGGTWKAKP